MASLPTCISPQSPVLSHGPLPLPRVHSCSSAPVPHAGTVHVSSFPLCSSQLWGLLEGGAQRVVLELVKRRWTLAQLDSLPFGVALPLRQALHQCRSSPPGDWPREAYVLIGEWG